MDASRIAQDLLSHLVRTNRTIATAESLTAGLASLRLAQAEGASEAFAGGAVAYSRGAKGQLLNVSARTTISRQCALEMAEGAAEKFCTDVAVAFTGVAGPESLEHTPVGTVWIAWTIDGESDAVCLNFPEAHPDEIREQAIAAAFAIICEQLSDVVAERTAAVAS